MSTRGLGSIAVFYFGGNALVTYDEFVEHEIQHESVAKGIALRLLDEDEVSNEADTPHDYREWRLINPEILRSQMQAREEDTNDA